jgi:hypothetical protein
MSDPLGLNAQLIKDLRGLAGAREDVVLIKRERKFSLIPPCRRIVDSAMPASIVKSVTVALEITVDREAADFQAVTLGQFVWLEGSVDDIEIPRCRCEVIRADEYSVTVKVPHIVRPCTS